VGDENSNFAIQHQHLNFALSASTQHLISAFSASTCHQSASTNASNNASDARNLTDGPPVLTRIPLLLCSSLVFGLLRRFLKGAVPPDSSMS
jgi:hypothetical protein